MTLFYDLVPQSTASDINWPGIVENFAWFRALSDCPQDPVFHGEGDVGIHTRMVVEALISDPAWAARPFDERQSLFWAALLHDVAKPACTKVTLGGRIGAPGHSKRGEILARHILWRMKVPFEQRELICHLITHHQRPFFLIEKNNADKLVHRISYQTRCDLLGALARADATGRIAGDKNRILENVALFEEMCREAACFNTPKSFASPHSRFLYFRKSGRAVDYEAYDDWENHVTLLSGLPASGKDTWLEAHRGEADVVSLDSLRKEMKIAPDAPQGAVIQEARERARIALRANRPLVWNATNLSRQLRTQLIDLFADYRAKVQIVYIETEEAELYRRNSARARQVPKKALARMLDHWQPPTLDECHALRVISS